MKFVTRFAPSPTGPLHLGHAYSAMLAHDMAMAHGGEFLLRMEDIDQARSKPEWEDQIKKDLDWLGLTWPEPVMRQSERLDTYGLALRRLARWNLIYPCRCNRRDIAEALSAPQEGVEAKIGPDGPVYPGTCRNLGGRKDILQNIPAGAALRLWMFAALKRVAPDPYEAKLSFEETGEGPNGETGTIAFTGAEALRLIGDIVLSRKGLGTSYHLSVVLDDAAQDITHVVRGQDLFEATKIHVILQRLLGLPTPTYHHHRLIRDETGKRLAKRDDARALSKYRYGNETPEDVRRLVGLAPPIPEDPAPVPDNVTPLPTADDEG